MIADLPASRPDAQPSAHARQSRIELAASAGGVVRHAQEAEIRDLGADWGNSLSATAFQNDFQQVSEVLPGTGEVGFRVDLSALGSLARFTIGSTHWEVAAKWQNVLFGPDGFRMREWEAEGRVLRVKEGLHRTVHRVDLDGGTVYVKRYRCQRWWHAARHIVRSSPARREWERAVEIARRGVATVQPLACGEAIRGGAVWDSFLVTQAIGDGCSVEDYVSTVLPLLPAETRIRARRLLFDGLARFVARVHRAGIWHDDLHAGNILISRKAKLADPTCNAWPTFHLIDVSDVRIGAPLSWKASRQNLVTLVSAWDRRTTRTERLRFWRTYLSERPELHLPDSRTVIGRLESEGRRLSLRIAWRRDRRGMRANSDYRVIRSRDDRAHCLRRLSPEFLRDWIEQPESPLWSHLDQAVKLSHSGLMVKATFFTSEGDLAVAYKCYRSRNWWKSLCRLFGRDRAIRSWRVGQGLVERKIPTARPVAVLIPGRPRFGRRTYLATEWLEGTENLHLYGWSLAAAKPAERRRKAVRCATSLGRLVGLLHAWGISHGDLKASNLLVLDHGQSLETFLIDLDQACITGRTPPRGAVADLARLAAGLAAHPWVTRTVCWRFLREYARQFPAGTIDRKQLWRRVASRSGQLVAGKHRRGDAVL